MEVIRAGKMRKYEPSTLNQAAHKSEFAPLAAGILCKAFEDLQSVSCTQYIYTQFFYSNYCKSLFEIAGVNYDESRIKKMIADRPKMSYQKSKKNQKYMIYAIDVSDGYISRIYNTFTGEICRLARTVGSGEASYYYPHAIGGLMCGKYHIEEGI